MGFPENFKISESKSEAYKQVGNSVCIPMVTELATQILNQQLLSTNESQQITKKHKQLSLEFDFV
jgi:DNA (cytosine-5)-methyltransferase 1